MKNTFARRTAPGRAGEMRSSVARHLDVPEEDLVIVAELACHEPGCTPLETVVTLHGADGWRRSRPVHQPLA